jgi:hypothetical protein
VVVEGVERAHDDLQGDQAPEQRRHDKTSRNTAD